MDTSKTIRLSVRVHPRSRRQKFKKLDENSYRIHVTSAPSKGEANEEVRELVARHWAIPVSRVKIVRGHKSRNKLITIEHD
jgi:uncharacterized protein (TIGR00251 family)